MKNFLKGIVVGLGAVAPGLSGSILLVIFGLYQKIVHTVSTIFKNFKKNVLFLLPLALGIGGGMVLFSKLIDIPLTTFPMQTNYAFLGLILGTIPMVLREVRKEGFRPIFYLPMGLAAVAGCVFFYFCGSMFPDVTDPNLLQKMGLGVAVAAAYLVPGVDSFAVLSAFGLYNLWKDSLGNLDFSVLLPAGLGLALGAVAISLLFNKLLSRWYTGTYSIVFGLFLSVVLNFAIRDCFIQYPPTSLDLRTVVSVILLIVGFAASLLFSRLEPLMEARKARKACRAAASDETAEAAPDEGAGAAGSGEDKSVPPDPEGLEQD